jgi:hypothetical protein
MEPTRLERRVLWLWLITSALLGYWFAWVAVTAIAYPGADSGGNLVYYSTAAGHTVYPFTSVAAALGVLGVGLGVYLAERPSRLATPLALLVGYVGAIGMINLYEQVFLVGLETSTRSSYWWIVDWGNPGAAVFSVVGVTWVLASLPWWRRANLGLAAPWIALWLGAMVVWMAFGFPPVESGLGWVYALNALSRIASEMIPVALVAPEGVRLRIRNLLLRREWQHGPPAPSRTSPPVT